MSCLTVTILLAIICVYYIHQKENIKISTTDIVLISLIMYILLSKIKSKEEKFQIDFKYPNSEIDKTNMYKCQSDCVSAMSQAQFLIDNPTLSLSDCVMECMKLPK